jgi:hypothetical protein
MPRDARLKAADAFWRDRDSPSIEVPHAEAVTLIARRLKFREQSVLALPADRRAKYLAELPDLSDTLATRALIAYHFEHQRPLMSAFLDALGIAHENGLITAEEVAAPAPDRIATAVDALRGTFETPDVDLYLRTLAALDGDTWRAVETVLTA